MAGGILRWLKAPLWIAALATGAKSFADNPILGSRRLNAAGLHVARVRLAHWTAGRRRARIAPHVEPTFRAAFDAQGFAIVEGALDAATLAEVDALIASPLPTRAQIQGDTLTRRVALTPALLANAPRLAALLRSKAWRSRLAYVAGTWSEPLYYLQTIVGGIAEGPEDPQVELHADSFQPAMKAWLFLTDVHAEGRPLTYVPGSHRASPARLAWEQARSLDVLETGDAMSRRGSLRTTEADAEAMGCAPVRAFAVPANTLVVADTCGFHARARSDQPSLRVELWAYKRPSPFLPFSRIDPLSWGPIVRRREEWLDRIRDWLVARGLSRHNWPLQPPKAPIEP